MRTFHAGGAASLRSEQSTVEAKHAGVVQFQGLTTVKNKKGESIVMNRGGWMIVAGSKGRERERHQIVYGAKLKVKEGQDVIVAQQLVEWDPFSFSILTEEAGVVAFKDILDKQAASEHVDENTGPSALVIMDSPDEKKQPRIEIKGDDGKSRRRYLLPSGRSTLPSRHTRP